MEIEVVPGALQDNPNDQSGLAVEGPIVFEVPSRSPCDGPLQAYFDNPASYGFLPFSLIVRGGGLETFRWNFYEYRPDGYATGLYGNRFTFKSKASFGGPASIPRLWHMDMSPPVMGTEDSILPTDKRVEIGGRLLGHYPAVISEESRRLVLDYDFVEGGELIDWVKQLVELGTTTSPGLKTDISVIEDGVYHNYYGCFVQKYEQHGDFIEDYRTKNLLILNCDYSMTV